jgi:hypothetical protein
MAVMASYKKKFPMDRFGRIGGLYSLADLPVERYEELERECQVMIRDKEQELYQIKDLERGWEFVVGFDQVFNMREVAD